jgi:hypothetical protein
MSDAATDGSYWAEPVGPDGVVEWRFEREYPCGFAYAVNPSRMGQGSAVGGVVNPEAPGVHSIKADWIADQGWKSHQDLCGCDAEAVTEDGDTWMDIQDFDVTTVTLTAERYEQLLLAERGLSRG